MKGLLKKSMTIIRRKIGHVLENIELKSVEVSSIYQSKIIFSYCTLFINKSSYFKLRDITLSNSTIYSKRDALRIPHNFPYSNQTISFNRQAILLLQELKVKDIYGI